MWLLSLYMFMYLNIHEWEMSNVKYMIRLGNVLNLSGNSVIQTFFVNIVCLTLEMCFCNIVVE